MIKKQIVVGAVVLASALGFLASADHSAANEGRQQESPLVPHPFDPRTDRLGLDSTSDLNMAGRPGVVLPDLGGQRIQRPIAMP